MKSKDILKYVEELVGTLSPLMDIDAKTEFTVDDSTENVSIQVNFEGDDLGYLIGARGGHMKSLQFVLSLMVNKVVKDDDAEAPRVFIHVDVGGYQQDRIEKVEQMAIRSADDVRILGQDVDMEPMSPAERRVVHLMLENFDDVTTESHGEGRDRHVRIVPAV